ncbi:FCD domain-containing protein [Metapseudomonas boanensis]|uniref:FCD domain-containing protein n=1 Tax=Metapseudomonas boanensis TaxID=2822138 RepID=UPI0032E903FE
MRTASAQSARHKIGKRRCSYSLGEGQRLLHLHFDFIVSAATSSGLWRDHEDIVEAIAARDADAAENAAHEHTMLFQRRFLDFMQQNLTAQMRIS